ncbi:MAG TPA: rhodanese-like domain-containing protein [Candidatus Methylomirabilis sp.]|nr:rhodanese-like domain-containing protein [Candidatus Methylomirabilis sp.]
MKKTSVIVALLLALAVSFTLPASSAEIDKSLVTAAEKMLSTMPADFYMIDAAAAQQQIENAKPFLLDVRETAEMAKGKIADSVNIPIRDLPKMIAKLPESKTAPILTYCQVGYRGGMSVTLLRMWGYTNVRTIKGGLDAWEKAGLPVVGKS